MPADQVSWTSTPSKTSKSIVQARTGSGPCVPLQVLDDVPSCALYCVVAFVHQEYNPNCTETSSLDYLCTTRNPSGFTLGEAALRCVAANCADLSSEKLVYNICDGIMDAVPETISTLTATLPATLATSITTATGDPSTTGSAPATSNTLSASGSSSSIQSSPETTTTAPATAAKIQHSSLSMGTVAAIAVGSIAVAAAALSLAFFLFCYRRRRRASRKLSQRWSVAAFPPPPPEKDLQKHSNIPTPSYTPNQRYYASPQQGEERRSFWRKSINPAEIGVAVTPGRVVQTFLEGSTSSQESMPKIPTQDPAPSLFFPPPPQSSQVRNSQLTHNTPVIGALATADTTQAQQAPPSMEPGRVNPKSKVYNLERLRGAATTGRIPLTPVYDNGNFARTPVGKVGPTAYRWNISNTTKPLHQAGPMDTQQAPGGLNINDTAGYRAPPRKSSLHKSVHSESTTFEEDSTTEEELKMTRFNPTNRHTNTTGDQSSIKNLAYPQIPRPAATSRQANYVSRPRASQDFKTTGPAPEPMSRGLSHRFQMHQAGQSYLCSETTSSNNSTPPVHVTQRRKVQTKGLKISTSNGEGKAINSHQTGSKQGPPPPPPRRSSSECESLDAQPSKLETSPQSRLTPKLNSRGDLFLTVED